MCAISGQSYLISSVLYLQGLTLGLANIVTYPLAFIASNSSRDSDFQVEPCVWRGHFYSLMGGTRI